MKQYFLCLFILMSLVTLSKWFPFTFSPRTSPEIMKEGLTKYVPYSQEDWYNIIFFLSIMLPNKFTRNYIYNLNVRFSLQMTLPENLVTELVCQLLLDFFHLASFAIIAQGTSHLLICHFFSVSLLDSPAVCEGLLVFRGKLKCPLVSVHPPDTVLHVSIS